MKEVFKAIYDFVMDQFTLFDNPVWNYIAIAIVGIIAFGIVWNVVGSLYNSGIYKAAVSVRSFTG